MTAREFRSLVKKLPGAVESEHMQHPDFRRSGKVFATLDYPEKGWGMVKLTPVQQASYLQQAPDTFQPAAGAWGRSGSTIIRLKGAAKATVRAALAEAFRNIAVAGKRS